MFFPALPSPVVEGFSLASRPIYHTLRARVGWRHQVSCSPEEVIMRRVRPFLLVAATLAVAAVGLRADQGMWMPQQIPTLATRLRALGFQGDPTAFADLTGQPMGAIVSLGGCTASFVSPDALIVTNHHCVTGALQFNSTAQRNLLADGFLAATREEELSAGPGSRVLVTTSVKEVTDAITANIDASASDRQRVDTIERRVKERVAACEKGGLRCSVTPFFEGLRYYEIAQMEIRDVRLVYAPAEGIGVFGGETDNWRWPRHTGDWSFYRAYVGKDGKPAPFSKDNVPYKPAHWLKVAAEGVKPGDLVFVVGYPGRTFRHRTYGEIKETTEWALPRSVTLAQEQLALIDKLVAGNKEMAIKLSGRIQGLNNGLTNQKGVLEGLVKGGALQKKAAQEKELRDWIAAVPERQKQYGEILPALDKLQAEGEQVRERNAVMNNLSSASQYLAAAQTLYRLSVQRPKPDLEREAGYQERDWSRIREAQERVQRSLDPVADRAFLRWAMGLAAALPAGQRIEPLDKLVGLRAGMANAETAQAIDAYLEKLYAGTKMGDRDFRLGLIEKSTSDIQATGDSFVALAAALEPLADNIRDEGRARAGAYSRLRPRYMQAMLAKAGGLVAPDANSTLRVTYGQVKGVEPRDGLFYEPQTGLQGILEKQTGQGDFNAPRKQLDAIAATLRDKKSPYYNRTLGDVPVNFLSTVDTTGGNSGSPTLNARGEFVGLLFDGTYESVSSDYLFDDVKTRSIHVDHRYMLWNMMEVDGAARLVKEMGVGAAPRPVINAPAATPGK
jgi:hypothetical protein